MIEPFPCGRPPDHRRLRARVRTCGARSLWYNGATWGCCLRPGHPWDHRNCWGTRWATGGIARADWVPDGMIGLVALGATSRTVLLAVSPGPVVG